MKRILIVFIPFVLIACGAQSTPTPTLLPTAVPPENSIAGGGDWAVSFQSELPLQIMSPGIHRYRYQLQCPGIIEDPGSEWVPFEVTEEATILPSPVYLRLHGLSTDILAGQDVLNVHPDQELIAVVTLVGLSEETAKVAIDTCVNLFRWDAGLMQFLDPQEPFIP